MQNAGLQYGEGVAPVQESPFVTAPVQINSSNSTSSLRQFRKKDNVDKSAGLSGGLSGANSGGTDSTNSSHVARVAPHNHYPHKQNEYFRYPPQYQEYSSPPVKYSEISEPVIQPIPHLDHLPPSVLTKHKEKEYVEMCNIPQQSHLNKAYPEHQFNGQQGYPPDMHHQYMHEKSPASQMHSPYKPESQYIPKEGGFNHQISPFLKYNIPQSRNYGPLDNSSLTSFQRMDPHLPRSFMADHHHIREFPAEYTAMEQGRMYAQKQRYYPTPLPPSNSTYPSNYPHRNIPAQQYNYPSCNYPRSAQINPSMGRYAMNMDRSMSPRRTYPENIDMSMNFPPVPQKIPANYPNYPAYAQHYQQRRPVVPQEYYHHQQHPHSRAHAQYMPNHHPQEMAENHVASNNIRQYLENWAEEEPTTELPNSIETSKYISRLNREEPNEVYVINASELPQYLENGVPLIASENGQYIFKSNVSIDNTGAIKIIDKTVETNGLPSDAQERVVSLHIIENPKPDCLVNSRQSNLNPEHQTAMSQAQPTTLNVIATNPNHSNIENTAQITYPQSGFNTNRMNIQQVSPMSQNNPQNCETSINLSMHSNATNSSPQIVRTNSPQKIHGTSPGNDRLKIQVMSSYNEVPQNSCIVMPSTQNRLNFDESLLPNPVPCDAKLKKIDNSESNQELSNVLSEEAILKEAHEELDKIVQDTLTSTNMPLETCDRGQVSKIEEKCGEENINSRIPDYLNLDLESNPKDLVSTSPGSPVRKAEEFVENEDIMDLSTTSRRTSKSETEDQEMARSVASLSSNHTENKQDLEMKQEFRDENKDEDINEMDNSIKHMPLIFDGFEDNSVQKQERQKETDSNSNETNIPNENRDTPTTSPVDKKEEEDKKYKEENELKTAEEETGRHEKKYEEEDTLKTAEAEESVSELPDTNLHLTSPKESDAVTVVEEITGKETTVDEDKAEMDTISKETLHRIDQDKPVKTVEKYEAKEDVSDVNSVLKDITKEAKVTDSSLGDNNEHPVEDREEDKTEKQDDFSEQENITEVASSGIKRKRIFSVDDIIYRIGSTPHQNQNTPSDSSSCESDIDKYSNENKSGNALIQTMDENEKCPSEIETNNATNVLIKDTSSSQESYQDLGKHEIEEQVKTETTIEGKEEEKSKCTINEAGKSTIEDKIDDIKETSEADENIRRSPINISEDSKEESTSTEERLKGSSPPQSAEIIETSVNLQCEIEDTNTYSVEDIDLEENESKCELVYETEKNNEDDNSGIMFCGDDKEETTEIPPVDEAAAMEVSTDENSSEQAGEKDVSTDEPANNNLDTELEKGASPTGLSDTVIVSDGTFPVETEDNFEQKKIKILSNEILVQENITPICEYSEVNNEIISENLKRNISETDTHNEENYDGETINENNNKKIKLDDCEQTEKIDGQETTPKNEVSTMKEVNLEASSIKPCRFSVIQRIETIQHEATISVPSEEELQDFSVSNHQTSSPKMKFEEIHEENPVDEVISKEENYDDQEEEETREHIPPPDANITEEVIIEDESSTNTEAPRGLSENTIAVDKKSEDTLAVEKEPQVILAVEKEPQVTLAVEKEPQVTLAVEEDPIAVEKEPQDILAVENQPPNTIDEPKSTPKAENPRRESKEEISFEQRFVEPLPKTNSPETPLKKEQQEEKPPGEDYQYRSVLKIEENVVLLEICGELVEISVNQINGKKVITVVPISNSATVDINDNYEHTDRAQINEQTLSPHSVENVESEMPELYEESSVNLDEYNQEKKIPVLVKMTNSSEEISSTQTEVIETNEEIFEDIILNENEIIIGDESLEEEINLDLKSDEIIPEEKPVICTKAAKKLYEDVSGHQSTKPHSSLREFRKIKSKPEQQMPADEKRSPDDLDNETKVKKHVKTSTRNSVRQKGFSEQKEESQVALQELVKQRKMKKEKIRLKYSPYTTEDACDKPQPVNTGIKQEIEVRSEVRKVSKTENVVKTENQVSSAVHKVKNGKEMKRRDSSEAHGTKGKCKDKIRRRSVEEGKERIHIVSSAIVKDPCSNIDSGKLKMDEKPSSTSSICSNLSETAKDASGQNFQEVRTSHSMEVGKNPNVQEKHSKFPKMSTQRDLSLTKNVNEHYLSRRDHSNLKKKLSIQEYNSRKRKMEEAKVATAPQKVLKIAGQEEPSRIQNLEKNQEPPSTIYSGRQFENLSNCVKDPRRLQFKNSEHPTLFGAKLEELSSSRPPSISSSGSLSSGIILNPSAKNLDPLLNMASTNNQLKTHNSSIPKNIFVETYGPITNRKISGGTIEKKYEPTATNKRKVSFDDNVQINEIHTTQTKIVKSKLDSNSSYCEVTSSCSDNFEERGPGNSLHSLCDENIENTRLEYQNNLVGRIQKEEKFENNWEDSNSPKDCITDAFSDCFIDRGRLETKNTTKSKLIIDINDFDTSLINNELKGSYKTNSNSGEEGLKSYKEEVDIKLNSLNIQIPKTIKNRVLKEDDLLMHKFLRKEQLNSDEINQIRRIIYYKKKIQQLNQQNVINNNKTTENKYEIKKSPESSANKDLKLQLKKVDGKPRKKKKRFRNLYSNSPETSEAEVQQSAGEFSVYEGENISGVKLIFKRKTDLLNLQPVVKLQRCSHIDSMAKKLRFE